MIRRLAGLMERHHWSCLVTVVVAAHVLALWTFGATFWVDSTIFVGLGNSLLSPEKMRQFYDATGTLMYSHIGPGEPAIWACARLLPVEARWPAIAITQHALAAGAAIFAFGSLQRLLPGVWNLAGAVLLSFLPLHQSLHNALLTESVSSSLFLIGVTLLLRMAHEQKPSRREWAAFLAVVFLGTQFRTYIGALLAASAAVALLWRIEFFGWRAWLGLMAVCGAGIAFFPAVRWAYTGRFFGPSGGTNRLVCVAWANPSPSPGVLEKLSSLGWPGDPAAVFAEDFNYAKARDAGMAWQAAGLSSSEINRRIQAMSLAVAFDRPSGILTHLRCGLAASGMVTLAFAGSAAGPAYQHLSLEAQRRHQQWYYSWLSWTEHHSYRWFGEEYFTKQSALIAGAADAQRDLWAALEPHLRDKHRGRRDPLRLGRLPLDVWALLGWTAIAVCTWRRPILGLILAAPIVGNFVLMAATPIGNARYAHPILPIYFMALSASCGLIFRRPDAGFPEPGWFRRWRFRRARKIVIGAGVTAARGWFNTDRDTLDVLRREDFLRHWKPESRSAFLAEHVWEHFTAHDAAIAARNVFEFLRPGGRLRIAVPDGRNPDPQYLEHVRPGGSGPGADDHKVLWTVGSLRQLLLDTGFQVVALEYWDAAGDFHAEPWSGADGHVRRSMRFDPRNQDGTIRYTSLIIDGIKPQIGPSNRLASLEIPPVVLLVFRRPDLTRRVIAALREVRPSRIFIVADGPRPDVPDDAALCAEVRAVCEREIDWKVEIRREFAETNLGLRKRVSSGLDWVFSQVEDAIILEDDCVPQPEFFRFCAELLERYRNDGRVGVITGDNFQPQPFDCGPSYYFSRYPHCWGWATWRRAWKCFDESLSQWPRLRQSAWLDNLFPGSPGSAAYWRHIFDETHAGRINSWAYGWVFACWAGELLSVTPRVNLVENIGIATEATHTTTDAGLGIPKGSHLDFPLVHPHRLVRHGPGDAYMQTTYFGERDPGNFRTPENSDESCGEK